MVFFFYLGDNVFELALLPGVGRVVHHGDDGVVVLLVLVIEEHQLRPQVGLFCCPENLKHTHRTQSVNNTRAASLTQKRHIYKS